METFDRSDFSSDPNTVLRYDGKSVRYVKVKNLQNSGSACQYYERYHFWDSHRQDVCLGVVLHGKSATNTKVRETNIVKYFSTHRYIMEEDKRVGAWEIKGRVGEETAGFHPRKLGIIIKKTRLEIFCNRNGTNRRVETGSKSYGKREV